MKTRISTVKLNDGNLMPQFGLGVWQVANDEAKQTVLAALAAGYRLIDTAMIYENEEGVGKALRDTEVPREEIFLTTKVWNTQQGYDETLMAAKESLQRLRQDYVDLYLIHWPLPMLGKFVGTWKALLKIKEDGLAKSIGVSNFTPAQLQRIIDETGVTPTVNQVELHPHLQQTELREFHAKHGIVTEAWSPLDRGLATELETIKQLAAKHGRTPAQIILRWHIQQGIVVIPKSNKVERLRANRDIFDFELSAEDFSVISALDQGESGRRGGNPDTARYGV